ncbi:hypothetical protein ACJX0J_017963, partial [Zea mays]
LFTSCNATLKMTLEEGKTQIINHDHAHVSHAHTSRARNVHAKNASHAHHALVHMQEHLIYVKYFHSQISIYLSLIFFTNNMNMN